MDLVSAPIVRARPPNSPGRTAWRYALIFMTLVILSMSLAILPPIYPDGIKIFERWLCTEQTSLAPEIVIRFDEASHQETSRSPVFPCVNASGERIDDATPKVLLMSAVGFIGGVGFFFAFLATIFYLLVFGIRKAHTFWTWNRERSEAAGVAIYSGLRTRRKNALQTEAQTMAQRLYELDHTLALGLIRQREYDRKRAEILRRL